MYAVDWEIPLHDCLVSYRKVFDTQRQADVFADDLYRAAHVMGISDWLDIKVTPP